MMERPRIFMFDNLLLDDDFNIVMLMNKETKVMMRREFVPLTNQELRKFLVHGMKLYYALGLQHTEHLNRLCSTKDGHEPYIRSKWASR